MFLSDIFPTGYMAADFCNIQNRDTVAIWDCGPVGQFAIGSAFILGAGRVIAIDTVPERLAMAKAAGAETLDFMKEDVYERIQDLTQGRGADACIDAVGTDPYTTASFDAVVDRVKVATFMARTVRTSCARLFTAASSRTGRGWQMGQSSTRNSEIERTGCVKVVMKP